MLLDPKLDVVFKLLLLRSPELLRSMIEAFEIFATPIASITVLNPAIDKGTIDDKGVILDLRVEVEGLGTVDIEMQGAVPRGTAHRFLYYWAREYGGLLEQGEPYSALHPVISILWLGENLAPETPLHSIYELREQTTGTVFSSHIQLHTIELLKRHQLAESDQSSLSEWTRFLTASDEERKVLARRSATMKTATETLEALSADPEARRIAWERDRSQKGIQILIQEARKGGIEDALRAVLTDLLELRFGPLSVEHQALRDAASAETLRAWTLAAATATSVQAVFSR